MSGKLPDVQALGHGISMIPLPLPFRSPAWVNSYVIEGDGGLTLIDCGADWSPGWTALTSGLASLGFTIDNVRRLIVSHLHPDHVGMAPRLTDGHDLDFVMHERASQLYARYNDTPGFAARTATLGRRHGVPSADMMAFADVGIRPDFMPELSPPKTIVEDGDVITIDGNRHLEVIHTPGHEQAHICLRDSKTGIVFSGDHVLPRITPVIMFDEEADDVLADYLNSLSRLIDMRIGLTYPAHGVIVERGTLRCEQILLHHDRRLTGMEEVVHRGPTTAWNVMGHSYRPHLSPTDQRLALRETVAHLEHLRIQARISFFDEDDVVFYRT